MLALLLPSAPISWQHGRLPAARVASTAGRRVICAASSASSRLWSPTDLSLYSESPWASWLERLAREQPDHPLARAADPPDEFLRMLGRKGAQSEASLVEPQFTVAHRVHTPVLSRPCEPAQHLRQSEPSAAPSASHCHAVTLAHCTHVSAAAIVEVPFATAHV